MKKGLLALSLVAMLFTACKKDKNEEPANVTPTVANIAGTYKLNKITMMASGSAEQDYTSSLNDCEKDDQWKLNSDMSFNYVDAGTQCSTNGDYTSDWALTSTTTITIDGDVYTIRKFTGTNLEVTQDYMGATFVTYFTKQ
jgi:hypothetical protein